MADEQILCFPRSALEPIGYFEGLRVDVDRYLPEVITYPVADFRPRSEVEEDPSFLQVIPYVLVMCDDEVFRYRRGEAGTEGRLHDLYSVGVGGHINSGDYRGEDWSAPLDEVGYYTAMYRELEEELILSRSAGSIGAVAVLNLEDTPVDRVHFGVVHVLQVEDRSTVEAREDCLDQGEFVQIGRAAEDDVNYESWSRLCLDFKDMLLS